MPNKNIRETKAQVEVAIRTHLNDAKDLAKFDRKKVGEKILQTRLWLAKVYIKNGHKKN